jgi:hypothetical protein
MEEGTPGEIIAVIECPGEGFLASLEEACSALNKLGSCDKARGGRLLLLVHLTPSHIVGLPRYQQFMHALPDWEHLVAGRDFDPAVDAPSLRSSHVLQVCKLVSCNLFLQ